jgi:hypothetical protein
MRLSLLAVLLFALGCSGEPTDGDLPDGGDELPTPFTPGLALRIGGTGVDVIRAMRLDPSGNIVVVGTFTGVSPLGGATLTSRGGTDGFVAKYTPTGTLLWARGFGGTQDERVTDLAIDQSGNVYVGGGFEGTAGFDPTGGGLVLTSSGGEDGFITRFSADGTLGWAVRLGGSGLDEVSALTVDPGGNLYAGGGFSAIATTLPVPGVSIQSAGGRDGFILALTTAGAVRWAIPVGGTQDDAIFGVASSPTGLLVTTGIFRGVADFSRGGGSGPFLTSLGGADVFFAAFTPIGLLIRASSFGGSSDESMQPASLSLDQAGNAILLGNFASSVDFDPGSGVNAHASLSAADLFASRFDPNGNFVSVITLGGTGLITAGRAIFAPDGGMVVTGTFSGPIDFDPGSGVSVVTSLGLQGVTDAFVARFTAAGGLSWADRFGEATSLAERGTGGRGLEVDGAGNIIAAGFFTGNPDFDPSGTMFRLTNVGASDGFIVKLTSTGALAP